MGTRNRASTPTAGWLALAITVALVLVASVAAARLGQRDDPRADQRDHPHEPANTAADDGRFRLGPDQVPSVFGLTADQAVDRLEGLGLQGTVATVATCRDLPGRALWTRPVTGTVVRPGTAVTVTTAAPGARCRAGGLGPDRELAWEFLDFADGRGHAPPLAGHVSVYADGHRTTLTTQQAADPEAWPGIDIVRRAVGEVQRWRTGETTAYRTPSLGAQIQPGAGCGTRPRELRGRRGLVLSVEVPSDGVGLAGPCTEVTLFRNGAGAIEAMLVAQSRAPVDVPGPPDVVGDSLTVARQRLEAVGYRVDEVPRPDCGQVGTVAAQSPAWGEDVEPGSTVTLAVVDRRTRCAHAPFVVPTPLTEAADALIAFARGHGPAPDLAAQVEVYVGDELHAILDHEVAGDPRAWGHVLETISGPVARSEGAGVEDDSCLARGDLPGDLTIDRAWRLSVPEPRGCGDDWSVLLWVDDAGAIRAVDLLTGRT